MVVPIAPDAKRAVRLFIGSRVPVQYLIVSVQEREAGETANKKRIEEFVSSFNTSGDEFLTAPEFEALLKALEGPILA